jgi:hypothetical protein
MPPYEAVRPQSLAWRKASFCQNGECIEVTVQDSTVLMRNSAQPDSASTHATVEEFRSFLRAAKAGEFDDLADGR